ncbi:substrate-binding domain-containing protein [soil metagenome]
MKKIFRGMLGVMASLLLLMALAGCKKIPSDDAAAKPAENSANSFRILAGSELKDMADLVTAFGKSQNINVSFDYTGTLDAVDRLADKSDFDAVWISHGKYLQLVPAVKNQIKSSEKIMYSRVVLGVKPEVVKALGWKSGKTGWDDVVKQSKAGKFHFAMTNPTGSNTGFVALAGLAAELSGKGDALEEKDIPTGKLKELFSGQTMTAGSSGVLAEMFLANPAKVDGIVNYESVIRSMAAKGQALDVIIPKEGVITADYPLMLLTASRQAAFYQKLVEYLRSETIQKQIAATTFRTPLAGSGSDEVVNELPFPGSITVVDAILKGFLDSYSRPATSYFVLDVSGSMQGERIASLKQAMLSLTSGDASSSGRFSTFRAREIVKITPFSDESEGTRTFKLDEGDNTAARKELSDMIQRLEARGGTAIFDAIASIYPAAQDDLRKGDRSVSIVLETDGVNTNGWGLGDFQQFVASRGEPRVPIFAILYGDANPAEMQGLAASTGGRVFDAKKVKLSKVMKDIRTYQ